VRLDSSLVAKAMRASMVAPADTSASVLVD
jgi:hypothetical protein